MNIKSKPAIDAAFTKAIEVKDRSKPDAFFKQWPINKREFESIVKAARSDDGRVSHAESKYIAYEATMTYKTLTSGAAQELQSFMKQHNLTQQDLFASAGQIWALNNPKGDK